MKTKIGIALAAGVLMVAGGVFAVRQYIEWAGVAPLRAHVVQQLRDPEPWAKLKLGLWPELIKNWLN